MGTVQFGVPYGVANREGQPSIDEVQRILGLARQAGVDTLDTALAYGDSERRLGQCGVEGWNVFSKLPARQAGGDAESWAKDCLGRSLASLKVGRLAGLLLHQPSLLLGPDGNELYRSLVAMKTAGLVRKIGISVYDPSELEPLLHRFAIDVVQLPFNVLDRRMLHSGWLDRLATARIEIHARSCFLQGLLLMRPADRPTKFSRWSSVLRRWDDWLQRTPASALQACLCFSLSFPQIDRVIVGSESARQFAEIIAASRSSAAPVPDDLYSTDVNLINPSRWSLL